MTFSKDLRIAAIRNYQEKKDINKVCKDFGICLKTLYNWRKQYKNINCTIKSAKNEIIKIHNDIPRKERTTLLTKEIKDYMIAYMTNNPKFFYRTLLKKLSNEFNISISKSTFYNWVHRINLSYKKARNKIIVNIPNLNKQKKELFDKITKINKNKQDIISIDESSFVTLMNPNYGWSETGKRVNFRVPTKKNPTRFSVLTAINRTEIVGMIIVEGSINTKIFTKFIKKNIPKRKRCHLLMDNAKIHKAKIFQKYIQTTNNKPLYNIPYNPESNPIEHVFNKIKKNVRRSPNTTPKALKTSINNAFKEITKNDLNNFFEKSFSTLIKSQIYDT